MNKSFKGGMAFICLKGIFKIYYKQQQFLRQAHRQIKNYESPSSSSSLNQPSPPASSLLTSSERYNQLSHQSASPVPVHLSSSVQPVAHESSSSRSTSMIDLDSINTGEHFDSNSPAMQANQSSSNASANFNPEEHESSSLNHYLLYESNAEENCQALTVTEEAIDNRMNSRTDS